LVSDSVSAARIDASGSGVREGIVYEDVDALAYTHPFIEIEERSLDSL
jgi:hypothetical protein